MRPSYITLAVTSRCNLRCVMCDHAHGVKKQDFDEALLDNVGDFIASSQLVDLTGLGEPMFSELFWRILERYPSRPDMPDSDYFLAFHTNATLLDPDRTRRIMASRVSRIKVSIDAPDAELFDRIRQADLGKIVASVAALIRARNDQGRRMPGIGIGMTMMRANMRMVPAMIDLAKGMGADFLEVWPLNGRNDAVAWTIERKAWTFNYADQTVDDDPDLPQIVDDFHRYAEQVGFPIVSNIGTPRVTGDFPKTVGLISLIDGYGFNEIDQPWRESSIRCPLPWQGLNIRYEGDVQSCCWQPRPIGNIRDASLESVWIGDGLKELRNDLVEGRVPRACSGAGCAYLKGAP